MTDRPTPEQERAIKQLTERPETAPRLGVRESTLRALAARGLCVVTQAGSLVGCSLSFRDRYSLPAKTEAAP
jgi:hypothetical protein